eukprot:gnl/TRDRNA2_/TRDRNA2_202326_c0_seq1.p1 gnl/TRDRNA2_/TRDRNA2_202326_c0~~gnl/TRDRNA2_/TRDRNA2_202326_c0_seq1.p1  ORF type:complete len:197 (+),score=10.83 gnl/TRDRNA2_/TRDRNA2_202326_c0_seq1:37-627(+)
MDWHLAAWRALLAHFAFGLVSMWLHFYSHETVVSLTTKESIEVAKTAYCILHWEPSNDVGEECSELYHALVRYLFVLIMWMWSWCAAVILIIITAKFRCGDVEVMSWLYIELPEPVHKIIVPAVYVVTVPRLLVDIYLLVAAGRGECPSLHHLARTVALVDAVGLAIIYGVLSCWLSMHHKSSTEDAELKEPLVPS